MKKVIPINFSWYVKPFEEKDLKQINIKAFEKVDIPNQPIMIENNYFKLDDIRKKYTYLYYLKDIDFTNHQIVELLFEGVAIESHIYLNKKLIGHHESGYTPYQLDITDHIDDSLEQQELMVIVSGEERKNLPPFGGVVDYLGYVGIYREVYLNLLNDAYIKDVFTYAKNPLDDDLLSFEIETSKKEGLLDVEVLDMQKKSIIRQSFKINQNKTIFELDIKNKKLWSLDNPYLYEIVVSYKDKEVFDTYTHKFGFRSLEFKPEGFYLNGTLKKLIGLNRHQSFPYQGYAMPKTAQREDADILKRNLGLDIARSSHYPCSRHFLNRADEIGLLVLEEIPGWQYIGDQSFKERTYDSLSRMLYRDRNHASICLWGVRINESADDHDFYAKTNEITRTIDPTRQTCGIRNFDGSEFLEDVYTYNDFSHTGNNPGVQNKLKVAKKDVPYLVSEHNGHMFPTKAYDTELKRLDQAKRHLQVINDMRNPKSRISGSIGWVTNDYHTHPEFGSGDGICYHGVRDIYRMPKTASYSYLSQKDAPFVLELSSNMNLGEYPGGYIQEVYVFTNLDSIKLYKNDMYVDTFYPNKEAYPHLAHPPVIIKDFVGKMIEEQEHMLPKDANKIKKIIKMISMNGMNIPLRYKLMMAWLLKKYKLTLDDGMKLFYKYTTGWGDKHVSYRFEGYKEDVKVKEITKTYDENFIIKLKSNKLEMIVEDTYDTLRFEFTCEDQFNNIKQYLFDPIQIETKGSIQLIGPSIQTLNSGQIAIWVRSVSKGIGKIKVTLRDQVIEKEVVVK
ncbi:MAG: hypothetical protein K8Q99_08310 [Acholeplasmataceae bacterium]|nr:hypothetical protein [Acholeplasmataceae bacterium]